MEFLPRREALKGPYVIIPLTKGRCAFIDPIDFVRVAQQKWQACPDRNTTYALTKIKRKTISMHRFILNPPENILIDHKNRNGLDNRKENIRLCDCSQNRMNHVRIAPKIWSQYKGVSHIGKYWVANIKLKVHGIFLGCFSTEIEAARTYDIKATELFGAFALTNNISEQVIPIRQKVSKSSKFKGLSWDKEKGKWAVYIYHKKKRYFIGRFNDENMAMEAYSKKIKNLD